ncbi:MAG TPA: hypothetical protein VMR33_22780 [Candidatus Baltobacteraceae bacterium]|nr:hypothetical protein [Candidatus Baltobacteraceae bacterium]
MHPGFLSLLDFNMSTAGVVVTGVVGIVVVIFLFLAIWASRYTKVGPNQVLVVSGRRHKYIEPDGTVQSRGFRIVKGGGTFVMPVVEKVDVLSLELLTIDVQTPRFIRARVCPSKSMASRKSKSRATTSRLPPLPNRS